MTAHILAPTFDLEKLRADDKTTFFNLERCDTCASVIALEDNFDFVMNLVATLAPEPVWAPHKAFKACGVWCERLDLGGVCQLMLGGVRQDC